MLRLPRIATAKLKYARPVELPLPVTAFGHSKALRRATPIVAHRCVLVIAIGKSLLSSATVVTIFLLEQRPLTVYAVQLSAFPVWANIAQCFCYR